MSDISEIQVGGTTYTIADATARGTISSHVHGSISNTGAITSDTTVTSGDKLIIADSSDSSKLKRSNIELGTSTTTFLRNDGIWSAPSATVMMEDIAVDAAVEAAWPSLNHTLTYDEYANSFFDSVTIDGTRTSGTLITTAAYGDIVEIVMMGRYDPVVTISSTTESVTCSYIELISSSPRKTLWTFTMPDADISMSAYYND